MSDLLLGLVLGCTLFGVAWPWKGAFWMIRELRGHVRFLAGSGESGEASEAEHLTETLAEKRP